MGEKIWYGNGLQFDCTRCGVCCSGGPGSVRVSDAEISALADRFDLSDDEFRSRYTRTLRGGDISLKEKADFDCVFYDRSGGCSVYEDRPRQCRAWPFWSSVVFSSQAWKESAQTCPGMDAGRLFDSHKITSIARDDGTFTARKHMSDLSVSVER